MIVFFDNRFDMKIFALRHVTNIFCGMLTFCFLGNSSDYEIFESEFEESVEEISSFEDI